MKKTIIRNGLISAAILIGINIIALLVVGKESENFALAEVIGYAAIVCSLLLVFVGIREFELKHEKKSFWGKVGIGTGISILPSLAFGLYNVIYYKWIDPDFMSNYYEATLKEMESTMSAEEFEVAKAQTLEQMAMFDNLGLQFLLMFVTVFFIGLIISIISATYLQIRPVRD